MYLKYDGEAKEKGLTLISACGFDSIPSEIGALVTQQSFPANYLPSSIEAFIEIQPGEKGYATHATTYECVVLGISSQAELNEIRKKISYPKLEFAGPKQALKSFPYFEDRINRYAVLFPGSDASLVAHPSYLFQHNFSIGQKRSNISEGKCPEFPARPICCLLHGVFLFSDDRPRYFFWRFKPSVKNKRGEAVAFGCHMRRYNDYLFYLCLIEPGDGQFWRLYEGGTYGRASQRSQDQADLFWTWRASRQCGETMSRDG
jgi:hypothetical protein